jgi:hypothetical protein
MLKSFEPIVFHRMPIILLLEPKLKPMFCCANGKRYVELTNAKNPYKRRKMDKNKSIIHAETAV